MRVQRFQSEFNGIMTIADVSEREKQLTSFLELHGFSHGVRSAENILLIQSFFPLETLHRIALNALRSPMPDMALNAFERLSGVIPSEELRAVASRRKALAEFVLLCGSSPFLTNLFYRNPTLFRQIFLDGDLEVSRAYEDMLAALRSRVGEGADFRELLKILRHFKRAEIARIAMRDLCGLATLEEVTLELSSLASVSLQAAYEVCRRLLIKEYGEPLMETAHGLREARMVIIGMGKLGGYELNFSSDIDIVYFYESDRGMTAGAEGSSAQDGGQVSLHTFFVKLAEMISRALSMVTEDGFVFRVDMGLRPEGRAGDMATSLSSAEIYYESWGRSWERTAMLKARPVAGSLELGEQLLKTLQPFVYRKYLDYNMIEDMKGMKQKIDASLARSRENGINLKLGRGGIREIEFFIQTLQVIHAGKNPKLRERNSLKALDKLAEERLITEADRRKLSDAYRFLRTAEHRIQVVMERQTHNLPAKEDELLALACRCGFRRDTGLRRFSEALEKHRANVAAIYDSLFYSRDDRLIEEIKPDVLFLLNPKADADLVKDMLEERHFVNLDRAYENLLSLREKTTRKNLSERSRRVLERILPFLLQELLGSPDPDMALINLERFLTVIGNRSVYYYALLSERLDTLKLLISLFSMSEFLSKTLIGHPELLESMTSGFRDNTEKSRSEMEDELSKVIARADDFEEGLELLRRYHNREVLRIGLNDIQGRVKQTVTTGQLSLLAEACLAAAYHMAVGELKRFGRPVYISEGRELTANLVVIAMGKLGGKELNYHSDLDIIFVYDHQGYTVGGKQISNHEYFAKLAQKIISIMSLQTCQGFVYKIDTRLRPSGNSGPLVTSLASFLEYHQKEAQIWERQALTKARVVLGDSVLAKQLSEVLEQAVYGSTIHEEGRSEIHRLRMRMERELAKETAHNYNIKTGRGGLVDVEFIAQYMQLRYGFRYPELRRPNTIEVLNRMGESGIVPKSVSEMLVAGYRFLRKLENRLRIVHDHSVNDLDRSRDYLNRLARRMGYPQNLKEPGVALINEYEEVTGKIRDCYEKIVGGAGKETDDLSAI